MKTLFASTALIMLTTLPSFADIIDTSSTIEAATVFPEGATITRTATFDAPAGRHFIVIDDLPLSFDPASLRVTGEGSADFSIASVDHRIRRLPPREQTDSPEFQALEAELETLEDQHDALMFDMRAVDLKIEVAEGRLRMVENLMEREPQTLVNEAAYTPRDATDWGDTIGVLAEQMEIALLGKLEAERIKQEVIDTINDLQEDITKVQQRMRATQLPARENSIATIEVIADAAVAGTLNLEYRTHAAGWAPLYDLRLTQGEDASLSIARHARVHQNTGEAWDDVTLTLSTARPSLRMDAPMFGEQIATLWNPNKMGLADTIMRGDQALMESAGAPVAEPRVLAQPRSQAGSAPVHFETRGRTLMYQIATPADIDGDGTTRQIMIDTASTDVDVSARATPRLDQTAYLYATLTNSFDGPILPGQASTYVDGAFIGQSFLTFTAQDAELTLPFGSLDGISVSAEIKDRASGDYGILSTTNTQNEAFTFVATSVLDYDIPLTIYDRVPVSEDEDLIVEIDASPRASETDVNGVRGLTAWTLQMQANSEQVVAFGYELSWPGEQELQLSATDWPSLHQGYFGRSVFR